MCELISDAQHEKGTKSSQFQNKMNGKNNDGNLRQRLCIYKNVEFPHFIYNEINRKIKTS